MDFRPSLRTVRGNKPKWWKDIRTVRRSSTDGARTIRKPWTVRGMSASSGCGRVRGPHADYPPTVDDTGPPGFPEPKLSEIRRRTRKNPRNTLICSSLFWVSQAEDFGKLINWRLGLRIHRALGSPWFFVSSISVPRLNQLQQSKRNSDKAITRISSSSSYAQRMQVIPQEGLRLAPLAEP